MFDFVDLFAGVGGFHAALKGLGGRGVQAVDIDKRARTVYEQNWGIVPDIDVRALAIDPHNLVESHGVLTGGFPCQPFSKSGRQLGIAEDRGTLFHDVIAILEAKRPPVVMLENVRNLAGERQRPAWNAILDGLRRAGYKVSGVPCVFSPHLLAPGAGGAPQWRERVYILAVYVGVARALTETSDPPVVENRPQKGWDPQSWRLKDHLLLSELRGDARQRYVVSDEEERWIDTWSELLARLGSSVHLPGFPLWEKSWSSEVPDGTGVPPWKRTFISKNVDFYNENRRAIDDWRRAHPEIETWPASRRKLEWQAQDGERDLWKHLLQLRPSGIRVKRTTWAPALVAMNQTPIYGPKRRRLTVHEAAALQGFDPTSFNFGEQPDSASFKQMGNAVNVGAVRHVFSAFVDRYASDIAEVDEAGAAVVETVLAHGGETKPRVVA